MGNSELYKEKVRREFLGGSEKLIRLIEYIDGVQSLSIWLAAGLDNGPELNDDDGDNGEEKRKGIKFHLNWLKSCEL